MGGSERIDCGESLHKDTGNEEVGQTSLGQKYRWRANEMQKGGRSQSRRHLSAFP